MGARIRPKKCIVIPSTDWPTARRVVAQIDACRYLQIAASRKCLGILVGPSARQE